jgi:hypothetical protein
LTAEASIVADSEPSKSGEAPGALTKPDVPLAAIERNPDSIIGRASVVALGILMLSGIVVGVVHSTKNPSPLTAENQTPTPAPAASTPIENQPRKTAEQVAREDREAINARLAVR